VHQHSQIWAARLPTCSPASVRCRKGALQAQGLQITAQGTRISAASTRLSAESLRTKAQGDLAEAGNYDLASELARENEAFTDQSTRIQQTQLDRQVTQAIGGQQAGVASAGFASSGSALDLMRDSASQGALAKGVLAQQGTITEAGFEEQAKSFDTMATTGRATAARVKWTSPERPTSSLDSRIRLRRSRINWRSIHRTPRTSRASEILSDRR
jgi:hypothetical protein